MPGFSYNFNNISDYAKEFKFVEINTTFYKIHDKTVFDNWYNNTPYNFKFIIKIPRMFTHMYKLNNFKTLWKSFYNIVSKHLKEKLYAFLFQFPPNFIYNDNNINKLLLLNSITNQYVIIEFRHYSWFDEPHKILTLQKNFNKNISISNICGASFVIKNIKKKNILAFTTNKIIYIRLHGTTDAYNGSHKYDFKILLDFIHNNYNKNHIFIFIFNNTTNNFAFKDILLFNNYLTKKLSLN
jgi:uncharacterized protein YecE (DUF72 family)